jgi:hypothetical protein
MSNNEKELITIIREHDNPEKALEIAFDLLLTFLDGREAPQGTSSVCPRASA